MKTTDMTNEIQKSIAAAGVDELLGSPDVLFEGIHSMEIGLDYLKIESGDDLDTLLKKAEAAFVANPHAGPEIAITVMIAGLMRTESQGEALDFGLAVARAHDRANAC